MRLACFVVAALALTVVAADAQTMTGRGVLGVATSDVPASVGTSGALVQQVLPNSAASAAGLRPSDIIVAIDGQAVGNAGALTTLVGQHAPGETVELRVLRRGANAVDQLILSASLGGAAGTESDNSQTPSAPGAASDASQSTDALTWARLVDPYEQAFSTEVPIGWSVVGGMLRHSVFDASLYIRLISPDRHTYLLNGDSNISLFRTPVRSFLTPPDPIGNAVQDYLPGAQFAQAYVARAIAPFCGNLTITGRHDRPDLLQGPWTRPHAIANHDAGDVTFSCVHGNEPAVGVVAVGTYIYGPRAGMGNMTWGVEFLAGYVTPAQQAGAALEVLKHVLGAIRVNPDWMNFQAQISKGAGAQLDAITQQNIALSEQHLQAANARQHQFEQQFEGFDRIISGFSPYSDGAGNTYLLDNTKPYQWMGGNGRTVGTDGPVPPAGLGWQQMHEVPPQ